MVVALLFGALHADADDACGNGDFGEVTLVSVLTADDPADSGDYDPLALIPTPAPTSSGRPASLPAPASLPPVLAIYAPLPRPPKAA